MAEVFDIRLYRATRLLNESLVQMENVHEDVNSMAENFDALHTQIEMTHQHLSGFQDELQDIQEGCRRSMDFNRRCQRVLEEEDMDEMVRLRDRCRKRLGRS